MKTNKFNSFTIKITQAIAVCLFVFVCLVEPSRSLTTAIFDHYEKVRISNELPWQTNDQETTNPENNVVLSIELEDIPDLYFTKAVLNFKLTLEKNSQSLVYNYSESGNRQHHLDVLSPPPNIR